MQQAAKGFGLNSGLAGDGARPVSGQEMQVVQPTASDTNWQQIWILSLMLLVMIGGAVRQVRS